MTEQQRIVIRQVALDNALRAYGQQLPRHDIVAAADEFYQFMVGSAKLRQPKTSRVRKRN